MRAVMKEAEELCWGLENTTLGGEQGKQTGKGSWEGSAGVLSTKARVTFDVWLSVIKDTLWDQDWSLLLMLPGREKGEMMNVSS